MTDEVETVQDDTEAVVEDQSAGDKFYKDTASETSQPESKDEGAEINSAQDADSEAEGDKKETDVVDFDVSDEGNSDDTEKDETKEKVKIELGDDSLLDKGDVQRIEEYATENDLSPEKANDVLGLVDKAVAEQMKRHEEGAEERSQAIVEKTSNDWKREVIADPEMGGDNIKQTAALVNRYINQYGDSDMKSALDVSGLGNNPSFVRMILRAAKAGGDDTFNHKNSAPAKEKTSPADLFYADRG